MKRLRLGSDELEVELLPELGGRWHRLRAFGHDLLRTPDQEDAYRDEPFFWGAYVMAPWCNRVAAGPQLVVGTTVDLPSNFPDGTAIHGQVQALPWEVGAPGTLRVVAGGEGWPWRYEVTQRLEVEGSRLRVELELANRSQAPMPAGIGIHPWFLRPLAVAVAADEVFTSNERSSPEPAPVAGPHDLRRAGGVPPDLDGTWVRSGREPVGLRWPELGVEGVMAISDEGGFICAASPSHLGAVAIEPQTHAPDGLRRLANGERGALQLLDPASTVSLAVELEVARYSR